MRFLILTQYFSPEIGAPQVRLAAMIRGLVRQGHEVEVVTALPNHPTGKMLPGYQGKFSCKEEWEGVTIYRLWIYPSTGAGFKRILNYLSFTVTSLLGLARAKRPDYVFVESPPLFLSVPGFMAARHWRIPFIFNVADLWPDSIRELGIMGDGFLLRMAERLERWSYRKAGYVNAVTEGIRNVLIEKKGVPSSKVLFLPNGVDTEMFRLEQSDPALDRELGLEGKSFILYAGTLGFAQGLEVAIKAMGLLQESLPAVVLVFIGDGSEKAKLVQMVGEQGLDNVRFLSPGPPEYVARLYHNAYAGFASLKNLSLFEGARPSKIFPIMASGKPVLYSGSGEGAKLVKKAGAGVVVPPEDAVALAEGIKGLVNDPETAARFGKNGRQYVEENLSWPALIRDWLRQLEMANSGS